METTRFRSEIKVQKYHFGKPFPGLYSEVENLPALPSPSRTMAGLNGGITGKFGVVQTQNHGIVLVADGEYMEVTGPVGGLNLPVCVGRIPVGYIPVEFGVIKSR